MPRTSYGPKKLEQAWKLVSTLVQRQGKNEVKPVQDSSGGTYLQVDASLSEMARWSGLTIEGVREALNEHLGEKFLGIVIDQRRQKAGKGAEKWQFQLKLLSIDLNENRRNLVQAWDSTRLNNSSSRQESDGTDTIGLLPELDSSQLGETTIQQVQERCRQKIFQQHSRMRLLSGEEIGVDQLYVDVWLLEKPEHKYFITSESLLNSFDIETDRLALSKRIRRNSGFEVANSKPKLAILGKPGSGKTTFLKHLAIDWYKGEFQPDKIAILIELRQIRDRTWDFLEAIIQELKIKEEEALSLLSQGRLLILMDGLDEVPTDELRRNVQAQVKHVSELSSNGNQFILTCRTQIMGTIPSGFTSVEVADFSSEQVSQFVHNWFTANGQAKDEATKQWEKIDSTTTNQPDLKELTVTPVLLSLMCLVLQDTGEMPLDRSWLYNKGIKLLLSRWNNEKEIEGWEVGTESYCQLSIEAKEELLIEIAARKFESPKNFVLFEQSELVNQIVQKLKLANIREGTAVLKAIEAQHGLLIERADELWSFSHLTFQEYFTVQWLTQLVPQQLAEKIVSPNWQKTVMQLVKSQQPADRLLRLIKQAIDRCMTAESSIQIFLNWLLKKTSLLQTNYKPAAIRALYYSLTHTLALDLARALDLELALNLPHDRTLVLDLVLDRALSLDCALDRNLDLDLVTILENDPSNGLRNELDNDLGNDLALILDRDHNIVHDLAYALERALIRAIECNLSPDLISLLHQLKDKLPTSDCSSKIQLWWSLHGDQWIEQLQQVIIKHRNIGTDWEFTEEQQQQLKRYYDANKFLINLMTIEGAVTEDVRVEIEEGLLLPWAELQRCQPHLYS